MRVKPPLAAPTSMCISPHLPSPPPPPPPPPDPVNPTETKVHDDPTQAAAQALASRLGTSQLIIPLTGINVPN